MKWHAKHCPLCGSKVERPKWLSGKEKDRPTNARCSNIHCPESSGWYELAAWNTRPIEDTLRARIEAAEVYLEAQESLLEKFEKALSQHFSMAEVWSSAIDEYDALKAAREAWGKAKENDKKE